MSVKLAAKGGVAEEAKKESIPGPFYLFPWPSHGLVPSVMLSKHAYMLAGRDKSLPGAVAGWLPYPACHIPPISAFQQTPSGSVG